MQSTSEIRIGIDVIGVGAGALIFNDEGKLLLSKRGPLAKNERGKWEIPGGTIEYGETLSEGLKREVKEELGVDIEVLELIQVCDHILVEEQQHWVSPTYICRIIKGTPEILEPGKSVELGWFTLAEAEALPLAQVTAQDIQVLIKRQQSTTP
jgi:8-oxo-dGTP diphosphatase